MAHTYIKFKDVRIGKQFIFEGEDIYSGWERGPWKKTSARKYERVDGDKMKCVVGSINTKVRKV